MNLALLLQFGFSTSLQKLARWLPVRTTTHPCATVVSRTDIPCVNPATDVCLAAPQVDTDPLCGAVHRPLRVVRVLEAGQPQSHVGRMVISGCMADVCAELDRLVAREASLS